MTGHVFCGDKNEMADGIKKARSSISTNQEWRREHGGLNLDHRASKGGGDTLGAGVRDY